VSISPTFYEQLLYKNCFAQLRFVIFWQSDIGANAIPKMLVKLIADLQVLPNFFYTPSLSAVSSLQL
jgi:hypothetical protein